MGENAIGGLRVDGRTAKLLNDLRAEQRERLDGQMAEAAAAQKKALASALEEAVAFLPLPLRRQARKLLF